jgi:hypothetical protein
MLVVHTLLSIFAPILMAEAIYDKQANQSWLKPRACFFLLAAFLANVFGLGRLIAPNNRPSAVHYLAEAAFIGACLWMARNAPAPGATTGGEGVERSPLRLFFVAFVGTVATMVVGFAMPSMPLPAVVNIGVMIGVYLAFLAWLGRNGAFRPGLNPLSKFALASGMITFWILISIPKSFALRNIGPAFFGLLMAVFLLRVRWRMRNGLAIPWAVSPSAV